MHMLLKPRNITFGLLACLAAGCSSLSVEERAAACAATDWQRYGIVDGRFGVPTSDRASKFEDCAELGHAANLSAYQTGRAQGLQDYCTAENGYQVGYDGRGYREVCPADLEPDFLQGYERGRKERAAYVVSPGIGIGIGSGGVRTRVGIGIGIGLFGENSRYSHCGLGHICW